MEFILIDDEKLKVILSKEELEQFNITAEELDYSNAETKRMFWDIISQAKKSVGFSCERDRVLVRLYTSRDGSCELFISKLGKTDIKERKVKVDLKYVSETLDSDTSGRKGAYRFERLEHMIAVCRRLSEIGYAQRSDAFFDKDRNYYLFLDGLGDDEYFTVDQFSFINEFGRSENSELSYEILCEYGGRICENNAVEVLSAL